MCLTKRLLSEPLLSVGTGVQEFNRYPSTVNRQPCSCLMQWSDRELPAFGVCHSQALLISYSGGERRPAGANVKGDNEGRFAVKLSLIFRPRSINTRATDYLY